MARSRRLREQLEQEVEGKQPSKLEIAAHLRRAKGLETIKKLQSRGIDVSERAMAD
jgi:hypothetical protein